MKWKMEKKDMQRNIFTQKNLGGSMTLLGKGKEDTNNNGKDKFCLNLIIMYSSQ